MKVKDLNIMIREEMQKIMEQPNQHHAHPYEDNEGGIWGEDNDRRAKLDMKENDEDNSNGAESDDKEDVPEEPKKVELTDEDKSKVIEVVRRYKGKKIPPPQVMALAQAMEVAPAIIDNFVYTLALKYINTFKKKPQQAVASQQPEAPQQ